MSLPFVATGTVRACPARCVYECTPPSLQLSAYLPDHHGLWMQLVSKLICPVLKKLAVLDTDIRTKVFQLLGLISTKVKAAPDMKLPAKLLLDLFDASPADPELLRNTVIVYLQMAFERCSPAEQFELVRFAPRSCYSCCTLSNTCQPQLL